MLDGLRSSKYPYPCAAHSLGILMLQPRLATPALKNRFLKKDATLRVEDGFNRDKDLKERMNILETNSLI